MSATPDTTTPAPDAPGHATAATYRAEVLESDLPVVVDFWAPWCGPCRTLGPIIERVVAATGGRVELAKVDVDANPQLSQAFRAQSIPMVVALLVAL